MSEQKVLAVTVTLVVACIAANLHGTISNVVLPFLISSYIEHFDLTASRAGTLATAETLVTALFTFLITRKFGSFSSVGIAIMAGVIVIGGQVVTLLATNNALLFLGRGMVGGGAGILLAIANGLIGITADPERMFGILWSLSLIIEAMIFILIPYSMADYGYPGFYAMLAIMLGILLIPFIWLKNIPRSDIGENTSEGLRSITGWFTLVAILVLFIGAGALWAFLDQIASVKHEMETQEVGNIIAISMLFAFLGATCASALSVRIGRKIPIISSICLLSVVAIYIVLTVSVTVFKVFILAFLFLLYFSVPYLLGLAATEDGQGKFAALASVMVVVGSAIGPSIGGVLVEFSGYGSLAVLLGVTCVIAFITLLCVMNIHEREKLLTE